MPKQSSSGHDYIVMLERWKGKPLQARFVRRGFSKVWLTHQPGSPGFALEYEQLKAGAANDTLAKPVRAPLRGHIDEAARSMGCMARDFFATAQFAKLHNHTKLEYRAHIERLLKIVVPGECSDRPVAHWAVENMTKRRFKLVLQHIPAPPLPSAQKGKNGCKGGGHQADRGSYIDKHVKGARILFNWAINEGWQADPQKEETAVRFNPAANIKPLRSKSDGWHTMTEQELRLFLKHWKLGTMAHLAMVLLLYTALRRSDVTRVGHAMLQSDGRHHLTETKGRESSLKQRAIRLRKVVMDTIKATPGARATDTYLSMENGEPFSPGYFTLRFKKWCKDAGAAQCSPHSVRKHVATQAGNKGASDLAIAELLGHTSTKNVGHYVKKVNRAPLFETALDRALGADKGEHADMIAQLVAKLGSKGVLQLVQQVAAAGSDD